MIRIERRGLGRRWRELGALVCVVGPWLPEPASLPPAWLLIAGAFFLGSLVVQRAPAQPGGVRRQGQQVVISSGRVHLRFCLAELVGAWVVDGNVVLALPGGDRVMLRGSVAGLMSALEAGPSQLATRFDAVQPARAYGAFLFGLIVAIPIAIGVMSLAAWLGLPEVRQQNVAFSVPALAMFLLVRRAATPAIVVGFDGIRLRATWSWPQWVPKTAIRSVRVTGGTVQIEREQRRPLELSGSGWASAQAIADRIEAARRVGRIALEGITRPERFAALGDSSLSAFERARAGWALRASGEPGAEASIRAVLRASACPTMHWGMKRPPRARVEPLLVCPDGLLLQGKRGRTAALPWRSIRSFEVDGQSLTLHLDGRPAWVLPLDHSSATERARVLEALGTPQEAPPPPHERLARAGRSVPDWQTDLEGLIRRDESFREIPVTLDDARSALEAPRTSAEQRIGAALALAAAGSETDRAQIVDLAPRCAQPRLARALEAAARLALDAPLVDAAVAAERIDDQAWQDLERAAVGSARAG